jgi:hypothetical protein
MSSHQRLRYHMGVQSTPERGGKPPTWRRNQHDVYPLTLRHALRLALSFSMRPLLLATSLLVFAFVAEAAPKKKPAAAAPAKKPAQSVPSAALPGSPASEAPPASADSAGAPVRGPTRIDFDDRLIQGQTNKSGSVYLYDRKELKIRSMIKKRDNFRDEIVGSLYDT